MRSKGKNRHNGTGYANVDFLLCFFYYNIEFIKNKEDIFKV